MTRSTKLYGSWRSPITSELAADESVRLSDILLDDGDIYWNETRPHEGGRSVLVRHSPDGRAEDVNPPPLSARTRVHEYGGAAVVYRGAICYSNFSDQRLYRQTIGTAAAPLTPAQQELATAERVYATQMVSSIIPGTAARARLSRLPQGRRQPLRRQRCRSSCPRHA